jgi:putative ATPase
MKSLMDELFANEKSENEKIEEFLKKPLAERMRPKNLHEVVGQAHLIGNGGAIRKFIEQDFLPSIIFWGPPGTGKTTLANILAESLSYEIQKLSAIDSGVKELRKVIAEAQMKKRKNKRTLLFIDEIHRFNKSQQDSLLHAVESGLLTLIGATTENPSFEVNGALLSRCQVYILNSLSSNELVGLVENACDNDLLLSKFKIEIENIDFLIDVAGGDARSSLNALELAFKMKNAKVGEKIILTNEDFENAIQQRTTKYDKNGENHYDTISAFIKSMRGSDPDAAIFYMTKMLIAGEDPKFIARRMVVFASEDVGNADPFALSLAVSVFEAVNLIGMPECRINLAHGVTYLASAPKSNASYMAINKAWSDAERGAGRDVPKHLRNAPTKLMKQEGYGKGYKYPHDYPNNFVEENYMPDDLRNKIYYKPTGNGREAKIKARLEFFWNYLKK